MEQPSPAPVSAPEEGSSPAPADGGGAAAAACDDEPVAPPATSAATGADAGGTQPSAEASSSSSSASQRDKLIAGAELYEERLRRALAVPEAQRDADVRSFLAANAALEAAAEVLEAEEAAEEAAKQAGGSSSSRGGHSRPSAAPGSEERQLLAAARYLTATWVTSTNRGLLHPRLVYSFGPHTLLQKLLWGTVSQPVICFNPIPWLPPPSCTLPNDAAKRWTEPGAARLDARRLLQILLLADQISVGMGSTGALRYLAAAQRTLRNPRAAQQVEAGLAAMAARAGSGAVAPSIHELSVCW